MPFACRMQKPLTPGFAVPSPQGEGCELRFLPFLKDNELIGRCTSLVQPATH